MSDREAQPLLQDDRQAQRDAENDHIHEHIVWLSPAGKDSDLHTTRAKTQRILGSRAGHYAVLLLVTANVACIFADFLIGLYRFILASFLVNVFLKGFPQEVASIVIVLRFWRLFEIIKELSARVENQMDSLTEKIEHLEMENKELKKGLAAAGVNGNRVSE
ncbi:MAG: hypothetical protein Q9187_008255 [Circinaria calcarea]